MLKTVDISLIFDYGACVTNNTYSSTKVFAVISRFTIKAYTLQKVVATP